MTFTEAAVEVLRREGKPLHFRKITEIAIRENLLDHVGKIPEEVMAGQLAAHCRLPRLERRLIPVQPGTFALVEWGLDEDPAGLENLIEPPPEIDIPYRGRERHPIPRAEAVRGAGRERAREREPARARRREEAERHGKRYPPPAEVAYEILAGAGHALPLAEIAAQGVERLLMPDAFLRDQGSLAAALAEDNRRREAAGRSPLFAIDGEQVTLVAQPEPGERPVLPVARPAATAMDLRKAALAHLRRRLRACEPATFEHVAAQLLEKLGLRELKVAKRGRDQVIFTGRRRAGLADVRHCVRVLRNGADATRKDVTELRRDIGHYGAQIGIVVTAGDAARDARGEACAAGQLPIILLCGEALAEAFAEHALGAIPVIVPEVDEAFFQAAAEAGAREEAARKARREERERRDGGREEGESKERAERGERAEPVGREERAERPERAPRAATGEPRAAEAGADAAAGSGEAPAQPAPSEGAPAPVLVPAEGDEDDDEGEGEADAEDADAAEAEGAAEGKPAGEGRRRRRRRRRRGGRGRREAAAAAAAAAGGASGAPESGGDGGPDAPAGGDVAPPSAEGGAAPDVAAPAPSPAAEPAASAAAERAEPPVPAPPGAPQDPGEGGPAA